MTLFTNVCFTHTSLIGRSQQQLHSDLAVQGLTAKYFGLTTPHNWQLSVICAAIDGKDSLVVQPTGSGKSICYYLPPLYHQQTALVISPTISLMADQVAKLTQKGIPATLLGSAQKRDVSRQIRDGEYRVVFATPESFLDRVTQAPHPIFLEMAASGKLCLVAIDEAHLLESWKTFRYNCYIYILIMLLDLLCP